MRLEDRLVAGADLIREAQLPIAPAVQESKGQGAALTADRNRPAMRRRRQQRAGGIVKHRAEGRDDPLQRVDEALGIGAADEDAVPLGDAAQFDIAGMSRLAALLGKARADHDRRTDAASAAFVQGPRHYRRRHQDDREVGRFRQIGDRAIGAQAQHLALAARDGIDAALVAMADQRVRQAAAQGRGIRRGADHRDALGCYEGTKVRHLTRDSYDGAPRSACGERSESAHVRSPGEGATVRGVALTPTLSPQAGRGRKTLRHQRKPRPRAMMPRKISRVPPWIVSLGAIRVV